MKLFGKGSSLKIENEVKRVNLGLELQVGEGQHLESGCPGLEGQDGGG